MKKFALGVDIGGRSMKFGLFTEDGELIAKSNIPTHTENNGESILPDLVEHIEKIIEKHELNSDNLRGIGIGLPGPILNESIIKTAVNLNWKEEKNISEYVQSKINYPVKVGNDANVAALGETWKGAGEEFDNLVMVTLGTGVGGGIISDGKIHAGSTGSGGEIGHMPVLEHDLPRKCGCGGNRCLEQIASATGIEHIAQEYLFENDVDSSLSKLDYIGAQEIFEAAKEGDQAAGAIIEKYNDVLGRGLAILSAVLDPEIFILGGGVSNAGQFLLDGVQEAYQRYAFPTTKDVKFGLAQLGNDAGIYGAARLVLY